MSPLPAGIHLEEFTKFGNGRIEIAFVAVGISQIMANYGFLGRETLGLLTLARAPLYVLWKIPLYLGFFASRQTEWNRTRRLNEKN